MNVIEYFSFTEGGIVCLVCETNMTDPIINKHKINQEQNIY